MAILLYPFYLVVFWYRDVILATGQFFIELNRHVSSLLSLQLLVSTFFKPLKNEYRQGLVVFSIIFGMTIKLFLIPIALLILLLMLFLEACIMVGLIIFPGVIIYIGINGYAIL